MAALSQHWERERFASLIHTPLVVSTVLYQSWEREIRYAHPYQTTTPITQVQEMGAGSKK